jgi:hypothetical protein
MSNTIRAKRSDPPVKKGGQDEFKRLRFKLATKTVKIIEHFNMGKQLAEQIMDCLAYRDIQFNEQFSFKFDTPMKGKRIPPSTITLKEFEEPFKFYISNHKVSTPATCVITFDNNQEVLDIVFKFNYVVKGDRYNQFFVKVIYDSKFKLLVFDVDERFYDTQTKRMSSSSMKKDSKLLCSEEDELFLLNMQFNKGNTMLKEVLPEWHIPSAYDFNSYDYVSRLSMVDMLLV